MQQLIIVACIVHCIPAPMSIKNSKHCSVCIVPKVENSDVCILHRLPPPLQARNKFCEMAKEVEEIEVATAFCTSRAKGKLILCCEALPSCTDITAALLQRVYSITPSDPMKGSGCFAFGDILLCPRWTGLLTKSLWSSTGDRSDVIKVPHETS